MAGINWFDAIISDAESRTEFTQNRIDELNSLLRKELDKPSKFQIGVYAVNASTLASCHGLLGCLKVIQSDADGWNEIASAISYRTLEFAARSATRFANPSGQDSQLAGELFVSAISIGATRLESACRSVIRDGSQIGVPAIWDETPFHSLAHAMALNDFASIPVEHPYFNLLRAETFDNFSMALREFDPLRKVLVEPGPDTFSPFEWFPMAAIPMEVLALAQLKGWKSNLRELQQPRFMATPLVAPPSQLERRRDALSDDIAERVTELGGTMLGHVEFS